ncbi:MAG: hypothetical protein J6S14_02225 [Clostridia bacterium]|nr:hypothetical protein [Clostridia bacterium]
MKLEHDENGYLYMLNLATGEKRYVLVDVPGTSHFGLLKLGEPEDGRT